MDRRLRRSGITSSVARVLQCDSLTADWLRTLRGMRKEDLVDHITSDAQYHVASASAECPLMMSPVSSWSGPTPYVRHACSFCQRSLEKGDLFTSHFNQTLSAPFILTCVTCLDEQIK
jgi:hypothetical protein